MDRGVGWIGILIVLWAEHRGQARMMGGHGVHSSAPASALHPVAYPDFGLLGV